MVSPRMRPWATITLLLLGSLLAGCIGDDEPPGAATDLTTSDASAGDNTNATATALDWNTHVHGFVTDTTKNPLAGVVIAVQNRGIETTTNETGAYSIRGLVPDTPLVLIANGTGHKRLALQVVTVEDASVRLDFSLEERPNVKPYHESWDQAGLLACDFMVVAGHDHGKDGNEYQQDCAPGDPNKKDTIELLIPQGVRGIVIEVEWDSTTDLADVLWLSAETAGFGDKDRDLGEVIGPSPLRFVVAHEIVDRFYTGGGGVLRLEIAAHPEDDDEQAAGAAFAFQQAFTMWSSLFYVEPEPIGFSALEDADA